MWRNGMRRYTILKNGRKMKGVLEIRRDEKTKEK